MNTKIYIGVGHGGADSGAIGQKGERESEKALEIAKLVQQGLKNLGYDTMLSRTTNTVTKNTAAKVTEAAAAKCDLLIDIHLNAFNKSARGVEMYYPHKNTIGKAFATKTVNVISKLLNYTNRGAKTRLSGDIDYYGVTRYNGKYGGYLIECCFIDNVSDMNKFNAGLIAAAIIYAIYTSF